MDHTATAANGGPPPEATTPPRRGQKRDRGARGDDGEAAGAARGSPRRKAGTGDAFVAYMEEAVFVPEVGENDGEEEVGAEVEPAKRPIIDFLGVHRRGEDGKARSPMPDQSAARPGAAAGALDEDGVRALRQWNLTPSSSIRCDVELAHAEAGDLSDGPASPDNHEGWFAVVPNDAVDGFAAAADGGAPNPSIGFGFFDLNQPPCPSSDVSEDEGFTVVSDDAIDGSGSSAATAGDDDGSVESVHDATVRRPSSSGFGFDLNQPCPSELPDGAPDLSRVPDHALPAPAAAEEDSLAGPDADERPELPDGGAAAPAATSQTRRQRSLSRLLDWAFEWTNGLALGPGWKRGRR